jgi:uncharacterized membrane protein
LKNSCFASHVFFFARTIHSPIIFTDLKASNTLDIFANTNVFAIPVIAILIVLFYLDIRCPENPSHLNRLDIVLAGIG